MHSDWLRSTSAENHGAVPLEGDVHHGGPGAPSLAQPGRDEGRWQGTLSRRPHLPGRAVRRHHRGLCPAVLGGTAADRGDPAHLPRRDARSTAAPGARPQSARRRGRPPASYRAAPSQAESIPWPACRASRRRAARATRRCWNLLFLRRRREQRRSFPWWRAGRRIFSFCSSANGTHFLKKEQFPFPPGSQVHGTTVCDALFPHSRPQPILPVAKRVRFGDDILPHEPLASPVWDPGSSVRMPQNAPPSVPSTPTPFRCTTTCMSIVPLEPLAQHLEAWPGLQRGPFEPLDSVELKFLSLKTALLTALTSIKRVGDLQAFSVSEECLVFGPFYSHVVLRPRPGYVPKVPTTPYRDQVVNLQALPSEEADPALALLCPVRALRIYVDRTRSVRSSEQLFVCHGGQQKGKAVSKQRLAHWIVEAVALAYQSQGELCLLGGYILPCVGARRLFGRHLQSCGLGDTEHLCKILQSPRWASFFPCIG